MSKRIIIMCDGTWQSSDSKNTTNVVAIRNELVTVDRNGVKQEKIYDAGVGSKGNWFRRAFEGATGTGVSKNIREVYYELMQTFDPGDELFLFGFSRGAFTVRSLSGMIRNCGIIKRTGDKDKDEDLVRQAFAMYRSRNEDDHPSGSNAKWFRRDFAEETNIKFIGVWDTVGSLGSPLLRDASPLAWSSRFHDTGLSKIVENAYHALSIDEKRLSFQPCLWDQKKSLRDRQTLEQVWFAGVHTDVGGGYARRNFGDVTLAWMMEKAGRYGLEFHNDPPPAQSLVGIKPNVSWKSFYKTMVPYIRPVRLGKTTNDSIHESAVEKYQKDEDYKPLNLEPPLG